MESLFEALRLAIELLAGHFHADLDFQHDAVGIDAQQRGLGFRDVHAGDVAASSSDSVTTRTSFQAPG